MGRIGPANGHAPVRAQNARYGPTYGFAGNPIRTGEFSRLRAFCGFGLVIASRLCPILGGFGAMGTGEGFIGWHGSLRPPLVRPP